MSVKQILFYTRPWEVDFHLELARDLQREYPDVPVRFATFFISSFRKAEAAGYEAVYFPDEMNKVSGDEISAERFAEIDQQLYATGGANFNLMLNSERFLPDSAEEAELFGRKHLVVLDRLVTAGTLSISSMYDHFVYWLAGSLANARNGFHFAFVGCGVPSMRTLVLKTPWETWKLPSVDISESEVLLHKSRKDLFVPVADRISYMKPKVHKSRGFMERIEFFKDMRFDKLNGSYFWETYISPAQWVGEKVLPDYIYKKLFFHPVPNYDLKTTDDIMKLKDKYVYLPLHMEPEAVIFMYSPWLRDQVEVVRLVAQAMPVGWKLVVKENPKMVGTRSMKFAKKIQALPNVRFSSPEVCSTTLIKGCEAVVALAGTAALEGRLLDKIAICLGAPPSLGMLSGGDIASGNLVLRELFLMLKKGELSGHGFDEEQWHVYVSGTVEVLPEKDNANVFIKYISACVEA